MPYYEQAKHLIRQFQEIKLTHVRRGLNAQADALASLAASLSLPSEKVVTVFVFVGERRVLFPLTEVVFQEESVNTVAIQEQTEDWRLLCFLDYLQHGRLPQQKAKRKERRRRAPRFALIENELYRRSLDGF